MAKKSAWRMGGCSMSLQRAPRQRLHLAWQHGYSLDGGEVFRTEAACAENIAEQNLADGRTLFIWKLRHERSLRTRYLPLTEKSSEEKGKYRSISPYAALYPAGRCRPRRPRYSGRRSSISMPARARSSIRGPAKRPALSETSYTAGCSASPRTGWRTGASARIRGLRDTFRRQLVACGMINNEGDTDAAVKRVITALTHAVSDPARAMAARPAAGSSQRAAHDAISTASI